MLIFCSYVCFSRVPIASGELLARPIVSPVGLRTVEITRTVFSTLLSLLTSVSTDRLAPGGFTSAFTNVPHCGT